MRINAKIDAILKWTNKWQLLISVYLGILVGSILTVALGELPYRIKLYALVFLLVFLFVSTFIFIVASISYKYREIQISKTFFRPMVIQNWEETLTIKNEEGSADVNIKRLITVEENDYLSSITHDYWSDTSSDEGIIKHKYTKLDGNLVEINPENIRAINAKTDDGQRYINLKVKIPILKRKNSLDIECELEYPPGAFSRALENKMDFFDLKIYHPTRFVRAIVELDHDFPEQYRFDTPSFKVLDFNENRVGSIEVSLRKDGEVPVCRGGKKIIWELNTPKVGLNYQLRFKIFSKNASN